MLMGKKIKTTTTTTTTFLIVKNHKEEVYINLKKAPVNRSIGITGESGVGVISQGENWL